MKKEVEKMIYKNKVCENCKNTYIDDNSNKRCVFNDEFVGDKEAPQICIDRGDYVEDDKRTPSLFM